MLLMDPGAATRKSRSRRAKRKLLLSYLQAFHQARGRDELFLSLREFLTAEFAADQVRFFSLDVSGGELRPQQGEEEGELSDTARQAARASSALAGQSAQGLWSLSAPLLRDGRLIGIVEVLRRRPRFSRDDLEYLEALGPHMAIALNHFVLADEAALRGQAEARLEQEVRIAREIQLRFLPERMPLIADLEIGAKNIASHLVSGDYYDFIPIVDGQWGIVIGDVSGKGISAGLIMSAFRAALLAEIRNNFAIERIMAKTNRLLCETTSPSRYVTAFYGVYNEREDVLTYCNAGHNPGLLLRAGGEAEELAAGGTVLGLFEDSTYNYSRVAMQPGDLLLLYTDGLSESRRDGEELGPQGLLDLMRRDAHLPAQQIADRLASEAVRLAPGGQLEDDVTLVVVKAPSLV
ncbi:MAG TPA: PP2C family protein-serine/threonine phosphatase [Acidobacteriota bacterium]|nr:PP2C family protein-serine/threonine phosphatase [Acidobacteriota bacterium]